MANIALIGPGAIGGTIAAWLCQDPRHALTVAARTAFESLEVETPGGRLSATPRVLTDPAEARHVDWVLVATKAYDVPGASRWLRGFRGADTPVAVLQNGVEHVARFSAHVPAADIVPVMVDCPAERLSHGRMVQRGPAALVAPHGALGSAFADLFRGTSIAVSLSADIGTELWRKLCFNSAGVLSAVLLESSRIARHRPVADLMLGIVRECIAVGRAEGARLDDGIAAEVVARIQREPPGSLNSMLRDRLRGHVMEIDARNGVIVRLGRRHGIATPLNAIMVAMLEAAQGGA